MKENITIKSKGQVASHNLSININDISSVNPICDSTHYVSIKYAENTATLTRNSEEEILKLYFSILQCIQKANKNKYNKDFLIIYNNEPYLLSELSITGE